MAPDDPASATLAAIRADLRAAELAGLLDADPAGDYFQAALAAWQAYDRCAKTFRETIRAALAGEEAGERD